MSKIFLGIVNMSISAGWIVLAVLLLRLCLKKAPKWMIVLLWGMVAIRLICPFTIESSVSLVPCAETVSPEILMESTPKIDTGIPVVNEVINPIVEHTFSPTPGDSTNPLQIWIPVLATIWLIGIGVLLVYTIITYWRVKSRVQTAVWLSGHIYQSERVVSPFVLGLIKPKIYLPFYIDENDMEHVIAHEEAHIQRKDHWWKPLGFLLLTIHWFNPLIWLGYILLCRDIELACDEKVIQGFEHKDKAEYSQALLNCSVNKRMIAACPLAFGESSVKGRVKMVLNYKKPTFWILLTSVIVSVVATICFLTNPISDKDKKKPKNTDIFTSYEGVSVSLQSTEVKDGWNTVIHMELRNDTDKEVIYGDMFQILYKTKKSWIDTSFHENPFSAIGYILKPHETIKKSYTINPHSHELERAGVYRFVIPFSVKNGESYHMWYEFERGGELLPEGKVISVTTSTAPESSRIYCFTGDDAKAIEDYFRGLTLINDYEDSTLVGGMAWIITLQYENGDEEEIWFNGTYVWNRASGGWYLIDYGERRYYLEDLFDELNNK